MPGGPGERTAMQSLLRVSQVHRDFLEFTVILGLSEF